MFSRGIFLRGKKVLSDYLMTVLCLSDCDASSAQYFAEVVRKRSDHPSKIPEALISCMWAPCADYLLQDDCDFKNLYFSQKSPQCDPIAALVTENGNSGQNFNWSSIMWKTTTLLWLYVLCLGGLNPRWGAIMTHSLSLKAATPQPTPKKAWINQAKRLSSFSTLTCAYFPFQPCVDV